jgi:hypothetical protein
MCSYFYILVGSEPFFLSIVLSTAHRYKRSVMDWRSTSDGGSSVHSSMDKLSIVRFKGSGAGFRLVWSDKEYIISIAV